MGWIREVYRKSFTLSSAKERKSSWSSQMWSSRPRLTAAGLLIRRLTATSRYPATGSESQRLPSECGRRWGSKRFLMRTTKTSLSTRIAARQAARSAEDSKTTDCRHRSSRRDASCSTHPPMKDACQLAEGTHVYMCAHVSMRTWMISGLFICLRRQSSSSLNVQCLVKTQECKVCRTAILASKW